MDEFFTTRMGKTWQQIVNEEYNSAVDIIVALPESNCERYKNYLVELTGGKVNIEDKGVEYV